MKRLSGYVFDTYDDVDGQVLRTIVENPTHLPPFVKTAARLTPPQIDSLPDDNFALILFDGAEKMKKFATVDKGNTTLSVLYLLKQAHLLPPDAVKTAARNLMAALDMHGLSIPAELEKAAKTGASPVSAKSQTPYARGAKVNKLQYPEILEEPKESHDNPQLGKTEAAWDDVKERTNVEGTPGTNFLEAPIFPQKEKYKVASAAAAKEVAHLFGHNPEMMQQTWRETPYFDISGWDPSQASTTKQAAAEPLASYSMVKEASEMFTEEYLKMQPRARHDYCVKLASRMAELDIGIPDNIARYGATTYASDVESYVEARRPYVHEESHEVLDMLLEKRAHVSPHVFAEALAEFDYQNDLNWHWDGKVADPWYSTFGPSMEKVAESTWRYDSTGTRISEDDLENLARNGHERLCHSFGADFAKEFAKNPKAVFESLPAPNKLILARLASDRHAGTYTE